MELFHDGGFFDLPREKRLGILKDLEHLANPVAHEHEVQFLACLLRSGDSSGEHVHQLEGSDFDRYPNLAEKMLEIAKEGFVVDRSVVESFYQIPQEIEEADPSPGNADIHAQEILKASNKRTRILLLSDLAMSALNGHSPDEIVEMTENVAIQLSSDSSNADIKSVGNYVEESVEKMQKQSENKVTGIPTNIDALNKVIRGWQDAELAYIAGRPSMGKTSLALGCAKHAAEQGHNVGYISAEQIPVPLVVRLIKQEARMSPEKGPPGYSPNDRMREIRKAAHHVSNLPIMVTEQAGMNITQLKGLIRRMVKERGCDLVFFDYFQLLNAPDDHFGTKTEWLGAASRQLKSEAKRLEIPLVVLAQLNRKVENRGGAKRPQLQDLRGAGQIEEDADIIIFVYRPEKYGINVDEKGRSTEGLAELIVDKNRNREPGTVQAAFLEHCTLFEDASFRDDEGSEGDNAPF